MHNIALRVVEEGGQGVDGGFGLQAAECLCGGIPDLGLGILEGLDQFFNAALGFPAGDVFDGAATAGQPELEAGKEEER